MSKREEVTLKGSIKKWKQIVKGEMPDLGRENCDLCIEFLSVSPTAPTCQGCPVFNYTGRGSCHETPYEDWHRLQGFREALLYSPSAVNRVADTPELVALAKAELSFLEMLLKRMQTRRLLSGQKGNA